jgi:N-acetylneuraminate synthase
MENKKKVLIIAEAGVNHNGSLDLAKKLVDIAVEAKADIIKFQTFNTELCISKNVEKALYQKKSTDNDETQYEMVKKLELSYSEYLEVRNYCLHKGIQFISTAFDLPSLDFLSQELNVPFLKIPSGDVLNGPLLLNAAKTGKKIILSTGMCSLGDIEMALGVLAFGYMNDKTAKPSLELFKSSYYSDLGRKFLKENVTLLHCTTEYPAPFNEINLKVMNTLKVAFDLNVGLSDHSEGIIVPIGAVAMGAQVIEKHFTIDKNMDGPDHKASLNPSELKNMIQSIRKIEESLGETIKIPRSSEQKNMKIAKKTLVSTRKIKKGEILKEMDITFKRAGGGIDPIHYWNMIGSKALKNYNIDDVIVDSIHNENQL